MSNRSNIFVSGSTVSVGKARFAPKTESDTLFYVTGSVSSPLDKSVFAGNVVVSGTLLSFLGLSGSHQRLSDGSPAYLAGPNIIISTSSLGAIAISASLAASAIIVEEPDPDIVGVAENIRTNRTYNQSGLDATRIGQINLGSDTSVAFITASGIFVASASRGARADYSIIAGGVNNTVSGSGSFVAGGENFAGGDWSIALGANNYVSATYGGAAGYNNLNYGRGSFAYGEGNIILDTAYQSFAFGLNNIISSSTSIAVGESNNIQASNGYTSVFGFGHTLATTANYTVCGGDTNTINGGNCVVLGQYNTVNGYQSTVLGNSHTDSGDENTVMGDGNTLAAGSLLCTAIGFQNIVASVENGYAFGYQSVVSASHSVAIGYGTQTHATSSTALGYRTRTYSPGEVASSGQSFDSGIFPVVPTIQKSSVTLGVSSNNTTTPAKLVGWENSSLTLPLSGAFSIVTNVVAVAGSAGGFPKSAMWKEQLFVKTSDSGFPSLQIASSSLEYSFADGLTWDYNFTGSSHSDSRFINLECWFTGASGDYIRAAISYDILMLSSRSVA